MRLLRVHCAVLNARTSILVRTCSQSYGGHGERETPGHIPNPEAKPLSADGTALGTGWESRTPPDNTSKGPSRQRRGPSPFPHIGRSSISAPRPETSRSGSPRAGRQVLSSSALIGRRWGAGSAATARLLRRGTHVVV